MHHRRTVLLVIDCKWPCPMWSNIGGRPGPASCKEERKDDARMTRLSAFAIVFFVSAGTCHPQDHKVRIFLTGTDQSLVYGSNVSAAEIGKSLDKHCPEVVLTIEQSKADYLLQARDTGAGAARKPYKFTLFGHSGDRVFSTGTSRLDSAVKDVCVYLQKHQL